MIQTTPHGREVITNAVTREAKTLHLFVEEGELQGYGYEPEQLNPDAWDDGVYPDVLWEFEAAEKPARVMGYYVTDDTGQILFSENFPAHTENDDDDPGFSIGRKGDRIVVGLRLDLLFMAKR